MTKLARIAIAESCYGMRWEVLSWNKSAINFYKQLGGRFREHGRTMQLMSSDLKQLAQSK